jgi:hypothetical protein
MSELKRIMLVEDDERDVELTLAALDEFNLANEVAVASDGEEAPGLSLSPRQVQRAVPR